MLIKWLFLWRLKVSNGRQFEWCNVSSVGVWNWLSEYNNSSAIFIWFRGYCQPIFGLGLVINQLTLSPETWDHCFVESRICYYGHSVNWKELSNEELNFFFFLQFHFQTIWCLMQQAFIWTFVVFISTILTA